MSNRINKAVWLEQYKRWQIKVRKDGRRKTFTSPTPGRKGQLECQKKADDWLDGKIVNPAIRVSVLYDMWIAELKIATSKSHWRNYEQYGRNYTKKVIGGKKVASLTEQHLQDIVLYAYKNPVNKKPLSEKTLKNVVACVKAFIKYGRKNGCTMLYPENLYIPKGAAKSEKAPLQPDDLKLLFSRENTVMRGKEIAEWYIHAFRFAVVTGLRPGEINGLQKTHIKKDVCSIRGAINYYGEQTSGKNENAVRTFVMPALALDILSEQKQMLKVAGIVSPYIFPAPNGQPFKQMTYYKHWCRYRDHNGLSKRSPYEMRHTFFSATKTLPPELVKAMGGHGKDFDTFGIYGHEMAGEARETARLVDSVFKKHLG